MRKRNKFYMYSIAALSSLGIFLSSCTGAARTAPKGEFDDKVVIQTAQNRFYPLMAAFSQLVDLYNKEHANTPGFLPVELQQSEKTNASRELQLTNNVVGSIRSNSPLVPNIILADLNAAYEINRYNRLLDLSNSPIINANYFDSDLYNNYNKVTGSDQNGNKVYAIPFNLTTTDGLVFNKPVMSLIFDMVEKGGGTVDKTSATYKELHLDNYMTKLANKKWSDLMVKSADVYKDLSVNDKTFSNLESMFEFSKKFTDGLQLKSNPTVTGQQNDLKIFMIDYGSTIYQKYLWAKLGNSKESWLWNLKLDGNQFDLDFSNIRTPEKQKIIGDTYDFYKNNYTSLNLNDKQLLKSIYFATNRGNDWAGSNIRDFDTAFGIAPQVAWNRTVVSPYVINRYRDDANKPVTQQDINNALAKFPAENEVLWKTQVTKFDQNNLNKNTFWIGGSSLIGISTSQRRDEQTRKFLEWLFNNDTKINVPDSPLYNQSINQILNTVSSYVLTSKQALSTQTEQTLKDNIAKEQAEVDKIKDKPTVENYNNKDWSTIYLNKASLATLQDWLTFKSELTKDRTNNSIVSINTNDKANGILSIIDGAISGITASEQPSNLTRENLLKQINDALGPNN
ncbi:hypothetical protein H3143_00985 [Mycoplasma tullyi]|uniref:Mycoplasma lipoprotein C-terminal domain-containing protein n=1 Tax=Mycoplasma tullyi TaxID=1612150 RepID=A0A7D7YI19_9MOLU|nr:hypothetical protein [Mycoplasma tullyi]QMT98699.1 hypothetical protein H3143_00985 [Mycoplasma tullyi]